MSRGQDIDGWMAAPSPRMIRLAALTLVPGAALWAVQPALAGPVLLALAFLALLLLADRKAGMVRLGELELETPEALRMTEGRPSSLSLVVKGRMPPQRHVWLGWEYPEGLKGGKGMTSYGVNGEGPWRLSESIVPLRRGRWLIQRRVVGLISPWGLWWIRREDAVQIEARVQPRLDRERRQVAVHLLSRGDHGQQRQRLGGKGREFEKLREYVHGDSLDDIHWKATARRNEPITKVFRIERTQDVYVAIDVSRLSGRPLDPTSDSATAPDTSPDTPLERHLRAALVLGQAVALLGDRFGLILFHRQVERYVPAGRGPAHEALCREAAYAARVHEGQPDFGELFAFLRSRVRRRALILLLTDLDDPVVAEEFVERLPVLSGKHVVTVIWLRSRLAAPLFEGAPVETVDGIYDRLSAHRHWRQRQERVRILEKKGTACIEPDHERLAPALVQRYLAVRERMLV